MRDQTQARWLKAVMYDRRLSPTARVLGGVLLDRFCGRGGNPSVNDFAKAVCVSRRTTQRALNQLEGAGWIVRDDRKGGRDRPACIMLIERKPVLPFARPDPDQHQGH